MYTRKCPLCNKTIFHTRAGNCRAAEKKKTPCRECGYSTRDQTGAKNPFFGKRHTADAKRKISKGDKSFANTTAFKAKMSAVTSGSKNPNYGTSNYERWLARYGVAEADRRQAVFKKKLSARMSGDGNPMYGRTSPQGSGNGWSGWYRGWYFRSLKELSFAVGLDRSDVKWESADRKEFRIPYTDWSGNKRTYCPDFLVGKKLIEVKPTKLKSTRIVLAKTQAAEVFCKERHLDFEIVDPPALPDNEVLLLFQAGEIKFTDRYRKMFEEKFL